MRCKSFFRNERQEKVTETSKFKRSTTCNLPKEEYLTIRSLQNNRSVITKPAQKGSAVVEAEGQLSDEKLTKKLELQKKIKLSG